jgi:hypothetical protein
VAALAGRAIQIHITYFMEKVSLNASLTVATARNDQYAVAPMPQISRRMDSTIHMKVSTVEDAVTAGHSFSFEASCSWSRTRFRTKPIDDMLKYEL